MWTLETDGRGRRATVLSVSNGDKTFRINDIIRLEDDVTGMISSFRAGESDNLHTVEVLLFDDQEDVVYATNKFKSFNLNKAKESITDLSVDEAIGPAPNKKEVAKPLGSSLTQFSNAHELADHVSSLFSRSPRKSPRKKRVNAGPVGDKVFDIKFDDSSESDPDHEEDLMPNRKKNTRKGASKSMALDSQDLDEAEDGEDFDEEDNVLATPTKKPPTGRKTNTPRKQRKQKSTPKNKEEVLDIEVDQSNPQLALEEEAGSGEENENGIEEEPKAYNISGRKNWDKPKVLPQAPRLLAESTLVDRAMAALHPASDPVTHPCRDEQYDRLFIALESAIAAETGTCIYISGTPGTGKTSTVREVIGQLDLRVRENELRPFSFIEINGMKLVHPNAAYEHLWSVLDRGSMASSNSMTALESIFTSNEPVEKRGVIVVLLDELDQLVTKGQQLMYNFFNWPSLPHSRLIVIAVANTMDLPERILSNKISSRVGLTRVQFTGYSHDELKEIVLQRIDPEFIGLIDNDAIDYVTRKVAGVGGDARKVLNLISQAIQRGQGQGEDGGFRVVKTSHMRDVIVESQKSPLEVFLRTLGVATKVLLCALLARVRRTNNIEAPLHEVLKQAKQLVNSSSNAHVLSIKLYPGNSGRLATFRHGVNELVESGLLVQQAIRGEATQNVRLMVPANVIKEQLEKDPLVEGIV